MYISLIYTNTYDINTFMYIRINIIFCTMYMIYDEEEKERDSENDRKIENAREGKRKTE